MCSRPCEFWCTLILYIIQAILFLFCVVSAIWALVTALGISSTNPKCYEAGAQMDSWDIYWIWLVAAGAVELAYSAWAMLSIISGVCSTDWSTGKSKDHCCNKPCVANSVRCGMNIVSVCLFGWLIYGWWIFFGFFNGGYAEPVESDFTFAAAAGTTGTSLSSSYPLCPIFDGVTTSAVQVSECKDYVCNRLYQTGHTFVMVMFCLGALIFCNVVLIWLTECCLSCCNRRNR